MNTMRPSLRLLGRHLLASVSIFLLTMITPVAADELCGSGCTLVIKNDKTGALQVINEERAKRPLAPFSTFKIANSLIAIDTGVVANLTQQFSVDFSRYPKESWWPTSWSAGPMNLPQAYQRSALPIYQDIATQIGAKTMAAYLAKLNYGDQNISSGIDDFWLHGSLRISAFEQVEFLQRLYHREFDVKSASYETLAKVMLEAETTDYQLYAKTGGGYIGETHALGWYVGYVKTKQDIYYFALNLSGKTFNSIRDLRKKYVMHYLKQAGII